MPMSVLHLLVDKGQGLRSGILFVVYFDQLFGACSTRKLVEIHNSCSLPVLYFHQMNVESRVNHCYYSMEYYKNWCHLFFINIELWMPNSFMSPVSPIFHIVLTVNS